MSQPNDRHGRFADEPAAGALTAEEPDVTMVDAGEGGPGEDPDFDEAGEGVPDAPRDEENAP